MSLELVGGSILGLLLLRPWSLRLAACVLVAVALDAHSLGVSSATAVLLLLLAVALWAAGTVWYARRHAGWPGRFSENTLGRVQWLYPWLGSSLGTFTRRDQIELARSQRDPLDELTFWAMLWCLWRL